jgi:nucleoside-diphosphate-sugar epimerase
VVPQAPPSARQRTGAGVTEILVTGGNGFVGRHLVAALLERGDRVRVLALPAEDASWLEARGVAVHRGDVRDPHSLLAPVSGTDGVIHLAAMMDVWRPLKEYRAVNVTGTANVCRAALDAGVRRLVHMSSSSVYGLRHHAPVDEAFPLAPFRDPYPVTKAEGDELVRRLVAEAGLAATIVRPDQIFGPGDYLHFAQIADRLRAGRGIVVGAGDNALPLVYVTDAVQGLLLALDHEGAVGQAYNISSGRPLTQHEFLTAIADEIGAPPPRVHLPYRLLFAAGALAERIYGFGTGGSRPPITRLGVAFLGSDHHFVIEKARRELGYEPRVDLHEGVRLTARWYLDGQRRPEQLLRPTRVLGDA